MSRGEPIFRRCGKCSKRKAADGACGNCGHKRHTWSYVIDAGRRPDGGRRQLQKGGFPTYKAAKAHMQAQAVDRKREGRRYVEDTDETFGAYAARWLEERAKPRLKLERIKQTTFAIIERDLRNHLIPGLGEIPIQQLDAGRITRHYAHLRGDLSPKSIANVAGLLHQILRDAVNDGTVWRNEATLADRPTAERREQPTWTPAQVVQFLAHMREVDKDWHALYATIAATGIRRGEALGATWAETDLDAGMLRVRQSITKAGSEVVISTPKTKRSARTVPLPSALVAILKEHKRRQIEARLARGSEWIDQDLVFPNETGRYRYPDYVSVRFANEAENCGLPPIGGPHGLRHSLASALNARGDGLATISALLGHASTAITGQVYVHMIEGADATAVNAHAAVLFPEAL